MQCICGNNSKPSQCMSPVCHESTGAKCRFQPNDDICCKCIRFTGGQGNFIPPSYPESSSTQRLIISCMSVLVIVSLLLFFSRNIVHRRNNYSISTRERYLQNEAEYIDGVSSNFWHAWSGAERYRCSDDERSRASDLPPPYNLIKSLTCDITEPPPSYPGSQGSGSCTTLNEDDPQSNIQMPITETDQVFIPDEAVQNEDIVPSNSTEYAANTEEPISPISTSSTSPLL